MNDMLRWNVIQPNKKEWKIIEIYEGTKRTPNFQKGYCRTPKRQNNSWVHKGSKLLPLYLKT